MQSYILQLGIECNFTLMMTLMISKTMVIIMTLMMRMVLMMVLELTAVMLPLVVSTSCNSSDQLHKSSV